MVDLFNGTVENEMGDQVDAFDHFKSFFNETTNIKKLAARYPEGFSSFYALNRNLDKEKNIIDGKE